jgi:hypothetical protein
VDSRARVLMAKPYQSALKYPNYKKDATVDVHVRVIKVNCREKKEHKTIKSNI